LTVPAFALIGASLLHAQVRTPTEVRPNIVLILMDDLGYGDVGSYGAPDARTPHIDRIAREGVRMTDFYSNGPNCSPTRTAFITGRYQQRYDIEWPLGSTASDSSRGVLPSETTLPRLLKSAGYATGLVGKWHLGWRPEFHPTRHGFDEFFGFLSGYVDYYNNIGDFNRHDLFEGERPVRDSTYLTDLLTARATTFIEKHAAGPFFLELSYNATHWPFQGPGLAAHQRTRTHLLYDGSRPEYIAMLESADRGVGDILAALDRHGLTSNTLVIFTSDNGGEWLSRNAPLFHRKSTLWEGGIRVPAILRWPGHLPARAVSNQVGMTMDLTASILAAARITVPASAGHEGIDLLPLLETGRTVERTLFWRIPRAARDQRAVRLGDWKYLRDGLHEFLYHLATDIGERNDLAMAEPTRLAHLRQLVATWERSVDSSRARLRRTGGL
jgi:arylsulfatase A-like enzyme